MTPPHYTNSQNSIISFDYNWFLGKNLSNLVSPDLKLHYPYCHNLHRGIWLVQFSKLELSMGKTFVFMSYLWELINSKRVPWLGPYPLFLSGIQRFPERSFTLSYKWIIINSSWNITYILLYLKRYITKECSYQINQIGFMTKNWTNFEANTNDIVIEHQ